MSLLGYRVMELFSSGLTQICGTVLLELGAQVIVVEEFPNSQKNRSFIRGKLSICLDINRPQSKSLIVSLAKHVDIVVESHRPGFLENLEIGPKILMHENPRLIFARLTGYGQTGPLCKLPAHDINALSMSGLLSLSQSGDGPPQIPQLPGLASFTGTFFCAFGILAALLEREKSGLGQIVDVSITESIAYAMIYYFQHGHKNFKDIPVREFFEGNHYYQIYKTKDERYISVANVERKFYMNFIEALGLSQSQLGKNEERNVDIISEIFAEQTLEYWVEYFKDIDMCVTPVLSLDEASEHMHSVERNSFVFDNSGGFVPSPAPKLSRTPSRSSFNDKIPKPGENGMEILLDIKYSKKDILALVENGIVFNGTKSKM